MTAAWVNEPWLAIDVETTGVDPFSDRIVEVAAVLVDPDGRTEPTPFHTIVNPGVEIPAGAAAVHGITTDRAQDEGIPTIAALEQLAELIFAHGYRPVVMYNAVFDWPILIAEAERHGVEFPAIAPVLDPFLVDRMVDKFRRGPRKLVNVAQHYAVELDEADAHGAVADAVAAARVMRAIVSRRPEVGERSLASVYLRQVRGHEAWRSNFVDYKRQQGDRDFYIPPGWPIPARIDPGGLPAALEIVSDQESPAPVSVTGDQGVGTNLGSPAPAPHQTASTPEGDVVSAGAPDQPTAAAPGTDGGSGPSPASPAPAGEGAAAASGSPAAPKPALNKRDVATLASQVFKADGEAAPRGQKTKTIDRLRHALTFAVTEGRATSLDDCTPADLHQVHRHLLWIKSGEVAYAHDAQGVTFVLIASGAEHAVAWDQITTTNAA